MDRAARQRCLRGLPGARGDARRPPFGSPPKPYTPPPQPVGKINVTDPDSRNVKTPRGYVQGYNAQAVCNEQQIVVAAEVSVGSADSARWAR